MAFELNILEQEFPVITLRDNSNGTEAEIYAFGALLNAFRVTTENGVVNIVDGYDSANGARNNITKGFKSAKLSPFVCRMRGGQYEFEGKEYRIKKYYLGEHAIHGLVYDQPFEVIFSEANDTHAMVRLVLDYKGDDKGYPFPYRLEINWKLESGNRLTVSTHVSHHNAHPIPYTDGWHPYFKLGGKADEWTLQFNSDRQLEYDDALLPTRNVVNDERFKEGCSLRGIELDNSFLLDEDAVCILGNEQLKLRIQPGASYPVLQLYIPPHRESIAIENLSGPPDNFNNQMGLLLLQPGETVTFDTSYIVESGG